MPTKRRTTTRVLSADAQKAHMEQWAVRVGLPKEIAQEMLEKYGPYAYKIMKEAMQGPTGLMRKAGQRPKSSKNAIKFFAESEIDTAQLARVVGENELKVQNKLADYQITTASMPEPVTTETQTKAAGEVSRLDTRVDEHEAKKVELTEKQKRDMNTWARQVGLSKADMNQMIVKYGVTAYDIVHDAMYKPSVVMRNMGEKPVSSKKTIQYFLNNDVTNEDVAKAIGKTTEEIAATHTERSETQPQVSVITQRRRAESITHASEIRNENIRVTARCNRGNSGFTTSALCNGKPITELPRAANDSITTTSTTREINNAHYLIGGFGNDGIKNYYGMFQTTPDGIKNYAMYALVHSDKYGNISNKLFNKNQAGFQAALKAFQKEVEKNGYKAYNSTARNKLAAYIKSDVLSQFEKLGKTEQTRNDLVQLQRDYACEVASRNYGMDKVANYLKQQGIDPLEVKPAIWGVIFAIGDARGNLDFNGTSGKCGIGLKRILKGKTIDQINSAKFIDEIQKNYKTVYHKNKFNEKNAIQYAKDHLHEEHSVATARELSLMVGDPQLYEKYLQIVASQQDKENPQPYRIAKGQEIRPITPLQQMTIPGTVRV